MNNTPSPRKGDVIVQECANPRRPYRCYVIDGRGRPIRACNGHHTEVAARNHAEVISLYLDRYRKEGPRV